MTDLRQLAWLLRKYVAPHWPAVALLLVTSYLATALTAAGPVVMAPILDLALGSAPGAAGATDGAGLSLKNLGAAFFRWLGIDAVEDRFRAILWLAAAYFALGLVKGVVDFGNYLLALWIRVRSGTALQLDLFRHLLGLSMSFFTRHRAGELVSRLDADTRGATSGLETIVITVLTAPVLIAIYGYLMVRTSPRLVGAAAAGGAGSLRRDPAREGAHPAPRPRPVRGVRGSRQPPAGSDRQRPHHQVAGGGGVRGPPSWPRPCGGRCASP